MEIVKTFKNIDLIKVDADRYCVRKRSKSWLLKRDVTEYFQLNVNGTTHTWPRLVEDLTLSDIHNATRVFNSNAIQLGAV
jgi:hypothetical protein